MSHQDVTEFFGKGLANEPLYSCQTVSIRLGIAPTKPITWRQRLCIAFGAEPNILYTADQQIACSNPDLPVNEQPTFGVIHANKQAELAIPIDSGWLPETIYLLTSPWYWRFLFNREAWRQFCGENSNRKLRKSDLRGEQPL